MPQQQTILCAWKPVPFGKRNIIRGMINDGVFADFHLSKCLWRLFALCPLSAVTLFKYYQQKLLGLIDNKKNHSIWTPNGEMLQAFELCRLSISIKLQAQKLSQSECQPCLTLKNLSRWIKVSTLLNLPQILRVFKIQLGSVVTGCKETSPLRLLCFFTLTACGRREKKKRPTRGPVRRWYSH